MAVTEPNLWSLLQKDGGVTGPQVPTVRQGKTSALDVLEP